MKGVGTVVTGTLIDGSISTGDEVEIQPAGVKARVRGVQSHRQKVDRAQPGSRVALNLVGVDMQDLRRGDVVAAPGTLAFRDTHCPGRRPLQHLLTQPVVGGINFEENSDVIDGRDTRAGRCRENHVAIQ